MKDSGISWWFENQIDWDDPIFICIDVGSTNFRVKEWIEQELSFRKQADSRPLILYSSFLNTPNKSNLESRFPGLENVLSQDGYIKSRKLTKSLRLHSTQKSFLNRQELFVFLPKNSASKGIPFQMRLTGFVLNLYRLLTIVKKSLSPGSFLRKRRIAQNEHRTNESRNVWREQAINALYEKYEFTPSAEGNRDTRPEIVFQDKKFTFYDTINFREPGQLISPYNEAYFHTGQSEEVAFTISYPHVNLTENNLPTKLNQPKVVISTLVLNDFMFIEPWIAHYRKYGVAHFLIYFNHHSIPQQLHELAEKNEDVTVIPWDVPYSHLDSRIGKKNFHVAQPMQLHHSVIMSKAPALGTHMLYIDIDEYIIGPNPLNELINMDTDEIGFTNVWASSESVVDLISSQTLVDPKVDFTRESRKKSLRSLKLQGKWKIHGNAGQESIVTSHVMLHFGDIMKFEASSNFFERGSGYEKQLQPICTLSKQHPLRKIFDRQL